MSDRESAHAKKGLFFDELYSLDRDVCDSKVDKGMKDSIEHLRLRKASSKTGDTGAAHHKHAGSSPNPHGDHFHEAADSSSRRPLRTSDAKRVPSIIRSASVPQPTSHLGPEDEESRIQGAPTGTSHPRAPAQLRHSVSNLSASKNPSMTVFSAVPRANGKRKRNSVIQMVPEPQRIFKDLAFYFFPNNDTHPARRMRITKAIQYGATWIKEWCEGITHVVVDNSMNYKQVVGFLKVDALPRDVILVNEIYPADCVSFRTLLDPKQARYQVNGYTASTTEPEPDPGVATALSSQSSLPLKPAKKDIIVREPQTPSRADESSVEDTRPISAGLNYSKVTEETDGLSNTGYNDALNDAIGEARASAHIPLDLEDEEESSSFAAKSNSEPELSDEDSDNEKPAKRQRQTWEDTFQCMQKHEAGDKSSNPNASTIEILQEMCKYYDQIQDHWRTTAYRKAIASLGKHPTKILTKEDAIRLPFVGERLAAKIEEIVWTHRLRRLDNARMEPTDQVLQTFLKIYGVGLSQATRWVNQGFKTIEDLLEKAKLTANQRVGIAHFDDFQSRIPRSEVEQHGRIVREALCRIDPAFEVTIGGSYRRGSADSGDIDLIITKPDAPMMYIRSVVIETLVPQLLKQNFLQVGLATTHKDSGTKWHGASALPGSAVWRRIDLLLVPWEELGAALIYFTGNDIFNRSIRLLASKKGMRLNQRGLYKDVSRGKNRVKLTEGTLVEGRSERRIFEILGVPWRPPHHRVC